MNGAVRAAFRADMAAGRQAWRAGDLVAAYHHFERAHILGQRYVWPHAWSHWWLLRAGWRARDTREVLGQVPRILAALVFSRFWVPLGNTGRARVSAFRPMPVPADLAAVLARD